MEKFSYLMAAQLDAAEPLETGSAKALPLPPTTVFEIEEGLTMASTLLLVFE